MALSVSTTLPTPPTIFPFISEAIASRILCARTNAVLYWQSRSRESAKADLPLTSFTKMAIAAR
jgi:hypothetical protein